MDAKAITSSPTPNHPDRHRGTQAMNYRQLQSLLKGYREQGYTVPRLNSKKEVLQAAFDSIIEEKRALREAEANQWLQAMIQRNVKLAAA